MEIPEEFVIDDPEANPDEEDGKDPAPKHSAADKEGFWRAEAERLREPVKVKHLVFAEPLPSKKGPVVLKGLQSFYTRIRQMGLSVRRLHTDKGREFNNRVLEQWALSRDIYHTMSVPGDLRGEWVDRILRESNQKRHADFVAHSKASGGVLAARGSLMGGKKASTGSL